MIDENVNETLTVASGQFRSGVDKIRPLTCPGSPDEACSLRQAATTAVQFNA